MINDNKTNPKQPTTESIIEIQRQIIESLRATNQQQAKRIEYLEEVQQEHQELKAAFGINGNLTYYQAMAVVQTRQNAAIERDRNMINSQKLADREAQKQEWKEQLLKNNAMIKDDFERRLTKANTDKTKMLEIATRFYDMTEEQAKQYINVQHQPKESAVKHLILEYTQGGPKNAIFIGILRPEMYG